MFGFEVGDIVKGNGSGRGFAYTYTDSRAVMEVVSVVGDYRMSVKILSHPDLAADVLDHIFDVEQRFFSLISKARHKVMFDNRRIDNV